MKIAHVIPHSITFPLAEHNGRYEWLLELVTHQVAAGHEVTIYCNPNSHVNGVTIKGASDNLYDKKEQNLANFKLAFENEHDIYHSHFDSLHFEAAHLTQKIIVFTQHWWPTKESVGLAQMTHPTNVWAVPPTKYMHDFDVANGMQTKGYIHHGVDLSPFRACDPSEKNGRLLSVGRIAPEKNIELSIRVAQAADVGLDIIGRIPDKYQQYYEKSIAPQIDGENVRYLGSMHKPELALHYAKALALLFPSDIHEAFGLVGIEAQACGTPVIMQSGGSRGELIIDGVTGFLCGTDEQFITSVKKSASINDGDCISFAQKFSIETMVSEYTKLYSVLLS